MMLSRPAALLGLLFAALLAVTGCLPTVVVTPEVSPPDFFEESIESGWPFNYEDLALGQMTIERYRRTGLKSGRQVTRMRISDGSKQWRVSCLLELKNKRVQRVCSLFHDEVHGVLVLEGAGAEPLSGVLYAPSPLQLEGLAAGAKLLGSYTPTLVVLGQNGVEDSDGMVVGNVVKVGSRTTVRMRRGADAREHSWMRLLGLLQASLSDPRDIALTDDLGLDEEGNGPTPANAYKLRKRNDSDGSADDARLAELGELAKKLEQEGYKDAAAQLGRLSELERDQVFDEEAGTAIHRNAVRLWIAEVAVDGLWLPDSDGQMTESANGVRFHLGVGVSIYEHTTVLLGWGGQFPAFSPETFNRRDGAPAGDYDSSAFNVNLTVRHSFDWFGVGLEPVVGLSLRSRFASHGYYHPTITIASDESEAMASSLHVGLSVAPLVGLQFGIPMDDLGTRLVFFNEYYPEAMFWRVGHVRDHSDGRVAEASAAAQFFQELGSKPTVQVGVSTGLRLEFP